MRSCELDETMAGAAVSTPPTGSAADAPSSSSPSPSDTPAPGSTSSSAKSTVEQTATDEIEALKMRAERAEQKLQAATTTGRRRMASATRVASAQPTSLLANAWSGGGGGPQQLASAAVQNVPLQLQLLLPLLLLLMLFAIVSMIAYALDYKPPRRGSSSERRTHRRTASGETIELPGGGFACAGACAYTSPRRGFSYCSGSWPHGLVEEGGAPPAQCRPPIAATSSFALPPSYVSHPPERRSPGRESSAARGLVVDV